MVHAIRCLMLTGLLVFGAGTAGAQVCAGTAPFSAGRVQAAAGAQFADDVRGIGAELGVGAAQGPFAATTVTRLALTLADTGSFSANSVAVTAGYSFDMGVSNQTLELVQLCPIIGIDFVFGPEVDYLGAWDPRDTRSRAIHAGVSIGAMLTSTSTVTVVPSVAFAFVSQSVTLKRAPLTGFPERETFSTEYGIADVRFGFVFRRVLTVQPSVAMILGMGAPEPAFGMAVGINFGRR
jgi:hypothetical protein